MGKQSNSRYSERQGHGFTFEDKVIAALGLRRSDSRVSAWDAYEEDGTPVSIKCIRERGTIDCGSAVRMYDLPRSPKDIIWTVVEGKGAQAILPHFGDELVQVQIREVLDFGIVETVCLSTRSQEAFIVSERVFGVLVCHRSYYNPRERE